MEKVIINKPKEKELQGTLSWSTNILIRMFYRVQELTKDKSRNVKSFIDEIKGNANLSMNKEYSVIKVEDTGYLTFIDLNKDEQVPVNNKDTRLKQNKDT